MIRFLCIFLMILLPNLLVQAQKPSASKFETVVSMDGTVVHRIQNPIYLKVINKETYNTKDNNLLIDLTVNLEDRGRNKNVVGCVNELIQKSQTDSILNTYSVEALGLICANYTRKNRKDGIGIGKYFEGGLILHEGAENGKTEGLLVLNEAENKTESIAALKGLPVEKLDLNIEKNQIGLKYCTSSSGYTSAACSELDCKSISLSTNTTSKKSYSFTSCANSTCKGVTGKNFLKYVKGEADALAVIESKHADQNFKRTKWYQSLFGDLYLQYKRDPDSISEEDCLPCPKGYSFNGADCVSKNGCLIKEDWTGKLCKSPFCEQASLGGGCTLSTESYCKERISEIEGLLKEGIDIKLSDLLSIANPSDSHLQLLQWERENPKDAAQLKTLLTGAAQTYLLKLKKNKKREGGLCLFSIEMMDLMRQYVTCGEGKIYIARKCVRPQCAECIKALEDLSFYQVSAYQPIGCGFQSDQTQLYAFLITQLRQEYEARETLCEAGRVDVCREFQPIKLEEVRSMARRIGLTCSGTVDASPSSKGRY